MFSTNCEECNKISKMLMAMFAGKSMLALNLKIEHEARTGHKVPMFYLDTEGSFNVRK